MEEKWYLEYTVKGKDGLDLHGLHGSLENEEILLKTTTKGEAINEAKAKWAKLKADAGNLRLYDPHVVQRIQLE